MAYLIGSLIGGLIGSYLIYSLLHWAIFKRTTPDRLRSHVLAAITAYPVSVVLYGLSEVDISGFRFDGFINYLLPSLLILALAIKRGRDEQRKSLESIESAVFQ